MAATFTVELLVLILGLGSGVFTQSICKEQTHNPCLCTLKNGSVINIQPDGLEGGSPRFSVVPYGNRNVTISYNPCYSFKFTSGCENVAGCHNGTSSLGSQDSAIWTAPDNNIFITYKENNMQTLSVLLKCNATLESSTFTVQGIDNGTKVNATLESKCACPDGCNNPAASTTGTPPSTTDTPPSTTRRPDTPSPKKKGISTGTLLIILFMVFLVVYLVVGIIYKKLVNGAQGKELIPNVEFWMALPGLVCDGVAFTCNCFGKRKSNPNYDNI